MARKLNRGAATNRQFHSPATGTTYWIDIDGDVHADMGGTLVEGVGNIYTGSFIDPAQNRDLQKAVAAAGMVRIPSDMKAVDLAKRKAEKSRKEAEQSPQDTSLAHAAKYDARMVADIAANAAERMAAGLHANPAHQTAAMDAARATAEKAFPLPGANYPGGSGQNDLLQQLAGLGGRGQGKGDGRSQNTGAKTLDLLSTTAKAAGGDPVAIAHLADELHKAVENFKDKMFEAGQQFSKIATSQKAGEILAAPHAAMEKVGEATGNPFLEGAGKFFKELALSTDRLRDWNRILFEANIKFKDFSGGMASVAANQEVRDILLSMERGERRSGTAEYQAVGKHELEKTFSKWEDLGANLQNILSGTLANMFALALKPLDPLVDKANEALDTWMAKMGYAQNTVDNWIKSGKEEMEKYAALNRPNRFQP